jgi:hypothetical protein
MSGLKINFHKSQVYCFSEANEVKELYANIFICPISNLPVKYLRVPIDNKKTQQNSFGVLLKRKWRKNLQYGREGS